MGMISYLRQITPAELDHYINRSADLEKWRHEPDTIGIVGWDDLLKLITGSAERTDTPLYKALIRGGKCLDDPHYNTDPEAYLGRTYYLTPQEVSQLAPEVLNITLEQLVDKLEAITLDDEGNETWDNYDFVGDPEDILLEFKTLRNFYESASQRGNAVLLSIV